MPCLNEAETLDRCVRAAQQCIHQNKLQAEVIIADNGSTDGSQEIARRLGARVVDVPRKGYGSALMGGFAAARGRFLIMGDADLSYDFSNAMPFIERLRDGADMVMGSRFRGHILPGAMPWHHRWIGNPVLSWFGRVLFRTRISDFHCGLRAFTRSAYERVNARTTGMEFASELVAKAAVRGMRIDEVPITLSPDGRSRPPHLRSFRDGWRHLSFMLLLSPRWALALPGLLMMILGIALSAFVALGPVTVGRVVFDVHTLVAGSLLTLLGYQAVLIGVAARIYALDFEIGPPREVMRRWFRVFTLERGLIAGVLLAGIGLILVGRLCWRWVASGFGPLPIEQTLRPMILGATLLVLGGQTILMSFFYRMLGIQRMHGHSAWFDEHGLPRIDQAP
jgi:glycosyltransferase involved in cell wall biosynthesis